MKKALVGLTVKFSRQQVLKKHSVNTLKVVGLA
jgi:hypothetical protein